MTDRVISIAAGRRAVPVVFTRGIGMTLDFRPGDVVLLSQEEARRAITTGVAVPGRLVYDAPRTKDAKP